MKKILLVTYCLIGLLFTNIVSAVDLTKIIIPIDALRIRYNVLAGYDETLANWQLLKIKKLPDGNYTLDLGTITTNTIVVGSISTILMIDKPIWEAQPQQLIKTLNFTLSAGQVGSSSETFPTLPEYNFYLEYITIIRATFPVDYYNFELNTLSLSPPGLILGGEISPANAQSIFKLPIPIQLSEFGYKFILTNKSNDTQTLKVGIIISIRKKL